MPLRERAAGDRLARARIPARARRSGSSSFASSSRVAVVRGPQARHTVARACSMRAALDARLLRERLHELLVASLQRRELLDLVAREAEAARRAARASRRARRAPRRAPSVACVEAPLVHHAARERLLEAVEAASHEAVAVARRACALRPCLRREREDARRGRRPAPPPRAAPGGRSRRAPGPRRVPPSRSPSILFSTTKQCRSMPRDRARRARSRARGRRSVTPSRRRDHEDDRRRVGHAVERRAPAPRRAWCRPGGVEDRRRPLASTGCGKLMMA